VEHEDEKVLFMVQGPRDATNRVLEFLGNIDQSKRHQINILAISTSEIVVGRHWAKKRQKLMRDTAVCPVATVSHNCVGRVLDQGWTIESNIQKMLNSKEQLEKGSVVKVSLQDYLSHTEGGEVTVAPVLSELQPIHKVGWKRRTVKDR
jgi:hypothetical protein